LNERPKVSQLFNHEDFDGIPTLEHIFEGPTEEQVAAYIDKLTCVPEWLGKDLADGRSSIIQPIHPDTVLLDYLQSKYQVETNNPTFDIRSEIAQHISEQSHGKKKRTTSSRLVQGT
jgi:hypothetical protein